MGEGPIKVPQPGDEPRQLIGVLRQQQGDQPRQKAQAAVQGDAQKEQRREDPAARRKEQPGPAGKDPVPAFGSFQRGKDKHREGIEQVEHRQVRAAEHRPRQGQARQQVLPGLPPAQAQGQARQDQQPHAHGVVAQAGQAAEDKGQIDEGDRRRARAALVLQPQAEQQRHQRVASQKDQPEVEEDPLRPRVQPAVEGHRRPEQKAEELRRIPLVQHQGTALAHLPGHRQIKGLVIQSGPVGQAPQQQVQAGQKQCRVQQRPSGRRRPSFHRFPLSPQWCPARPGSAQRPG